MARHRSEHQLRWADLDAFGHVNNVVFLRYLQEARVDMLYVHAPAQGAEALASGVVVVRNEIEYLRPLGFSAAPVVVTTWVARLGAAQVGLGYEVASAAAPDQVVARAATTVAPYDRAAARARRLEPAERGVLERYLHPEDVLPPPRASLSDDADVPPPFTFACWVRFDDLDMYGHVNNVTYMEYLQEARVRFAARAAGAPVEPDGVVVARQHVHHRAPIPFRTVPVQVECRLVGLSARSWTLDYRVHDDDLDFATARSTQVAVDPRTGRPRELDDVERAALRGDR